MATSGRPSEPRGAPGSEAGSRREYWSDEFYEAVEQAFETVVEATGRIACLDAKKEKTRIREKIRKAGQACGIPKLGADADPDMAIQDFVHTALERLCQAGSQWFMRFPWIEPLTVFAWKVWPEFSRSIGEGPLRQAIQRAVSSWLEENVPGGLQKPVEVEAARRPEDCQAMAPGPQHLPQPLSAGVFDAAAGVYDAQVYDAAAAPGVFGAAAIGQLAAASAAQALAEFTSSTAGVSSATGRPIYRGFIKSFSEEKGWGHIACDATKQEFGRDMFVMRSVLRGSRVSPGDPVSFTVRMGVKGPEADEVQLFWGEKPRADAQALRKEALDTCGGVCSASNQGGATNNKASLDKLQGVIEERGSARGAQVRVRIDCLPIGAKLGATLHGLCVRKLAPDSIGSHHLCVGDKLLAVNDRPVESIEQFTEFLRAARPGPVELLVQVGSAGSASLASTELDATSTDAGGASSTSAGADTDAASVQARTISGGSASGLCSSFVHAGHPQAFGGVERRMLILNGEDIGIATLSRFKQRSFAWEAVRQAISYYEAEGFETQTVVRQETLFRCPPPDDLWDNIVQCPALDILRRCTEQSSDRLFVLRLAQTYDCHFVDNTDYCKVEWRAPEMRQWVKQHPGRRIQYIFDGFGVFLPLSAVERQGTVRGAIPSSSAY